MIIRRLKLLGSIVHRCRFVFFQSKIIFIFQFFSFCLFFQELNVTGSHQVTDEGIAWFFGLYDEVRNVDGLMEADLSSVLTGCHKTLRFIKMRSTGVRVQGVRILLLCAKVLQGIRCTSYDVLQV